MSAAFDPDSPLPAVKAFTSAFEREFQTFRPGHREAAAYDAFNVTIKAIEKNAGNRERIRNDVATLFYQGVTGSFAPGHQDTQRPVYLHELRQGRYVLLQAQGN